MAEGFISLNRKILHHWVFKDAEYFKAWVSVLMDVNHSEQKVLIGRTLFTCCRGESLNSLETWGKMFGNWSKSKTKRFLNLLENDSMIELKNERLTTRLTVCNYSKYQDVRNANETQTKRKRNADETQVKRERATNNNELIMTNNENNEIPVPDKSADTPKSKFVKPSIQQIQEYCVERENSINPQKFFDHYESNGWVVGKTKMKDWKASIRTWEGNNYGKPISTTSGIISQTEQQRRDGQFGGGKVSKLKIIDESHLFV